MRVFQSQFGMLALQPGLCFSGLCLSCRLRWGTEDYPGWEQLGRAGHVVFCCQVSVYNWVEEVPLVEWMMDLGPRESGALCFCRGDSLV